MPHLLPWSQQIAVREGWLVKRQALLLDMMRRHNVEMWIVVNEEFHDDPLTEFVAPPRPYTVNRNFFVLVYTRNKRPKNAVTGYSAESVAKFFEKSNVPQPDIPSELHALWDTYHPAHIALGIDGKRGVTRSLTKSSYEYLAKSMGPEAAQHFVPAEPLITEYLETRLPEEFETYKQMVILTDLITKRGLSNEAITPGKNHRRRSRRLVLRPDVGEPRHHLVRPAPPHPASGLDASTRARSSARRGMDRRLSARRRDPSRLRRHLTWASIPIGRRWPTS